LFKYLFNFWLILAGSMLLFLKFSGIALANSTSYADSLSIKDLTVKQSISQLTSIDFRQMRCVATAVYYESAHEPHMGQIAVARVIQNRVRQHFAATPCDVIYQRNSGGCQFSWACNSHKPITAKECAECWQTAVEVFAQNQYQSFMPNALFFHATYIDPQWTNARAIKTIGHHKFYQKR